MSIRIQPLGFIARIADALMVPVMYLLSGTFFESPQRTHFWNNTKLSKKDVDTLRRDQMVRSDGATDLRDRHLFRLPIFHMPIVGGWRDYIVIAPIEHELSWHAGWITDGVIGISRLQFRGPVRVLRGPGMADFFGFDSTGHSQIPIRMIGEGRIGTGGPYTHAPLL